MSFDNESQNEHASVSGQLPVESTAIDESTGKPFRPTPYPRSLHCPCPAAKPARSRAEQWRLVGKIALSALSAMALVAAGVGWGTVHWVDSNTNTADLIGAPAGPNPSPPVDDGAEDILLVGSDSRTDAQGVPLPLDVLRTLRTEATTGVNTDTIILLRIPRDGGKARAISFPRDSYVDIPGEHRDKINAAYELGKTRAERTLRGDGETDSAKIDRLSNNAGAKKLIETVESLTDAHIDHYAQVNLFGFYLLTNAVGGVPVCLNYATKDKDSGADFAAGYQSVSGGDALSFVRQRKNLPNGDLDRILRQQVFLSSAANKVLSAGTLTSPKKLSGLVETVRKAMLLDTDFDILDFVRKAQSLSSGRVAFTTIPVLSINGRSPDGQSIVVIDPNAVKSFVQHTLSEVNGTAAPSPGPERSANDRTVAASLPKPEPEPEPPSQPSRPAHHGQSSYFAGPERANPAVTVPAADNPGSPRSVSGLQCVT